MNKEINLISSRRKESSAAYKQVGIIRVASYIALSVCIGITLVLFILNMTNQLQASIQQEQNLENTLLASKSKIVKLALVRERLQSIETLAIGNSSYESVIDELSKALPTDASFDSFEISKTKVSLIVSSASLLSVNKFLDYVIANVNNKKLFQKVTVSSLVGDIQNERYILTLEITLL